MATWRRRLQNSHIASRCSPPAPERREADGILEHTTAFSPIDLSKERVRSVLTRMRAAVSLPDAAHIPLLTVVLDQCDKCGHLLDPLELINPKCKLDGATPDVRETKHMYLQLDKLQPAEEEWFKKSSAEGKWSSNGIQITASW